MLYNFHTHHVEHEGERAIVQNRDSWGIHPWNVKADQPFPNPPANILAIGECGLDRLSPVPYELQKEAFRWQIRWSEELEKPLIIHCVKAIDDILKLHRELHPHQPWIIHGFRGKPQQMDSLLSRGLYVSFGFHFNPESLVHCPTERMLLETDEDPQPILPLYDAVSQLLGLSMEELTKTMEQKFRLLFPVL